MYISIRQKTYRKLFIECVEKIAKVIKQQRINIVKKIYKFMKGDIYDLHYR